MARFPAVWTGLPRLAITFVAAAVLMSGCAPRRVAPPAPPAPPAPAEPPSTPLPCVSAEHDGKLARDLEASRAEVERLGEQLGSAQRRAAVAEEQQEALRREMDRALEDLLTAKGSQRGVHNRAFAISRIAEVRVQLGDCSRYSEPEALARMRRAENLLARADRALDDGNYGGASYLADRAGDLVQHARTVAEVSAQQGAEWTGIIPIVPPRTIDVTVGANLREGPDVSRARVGGAQAGTRLVAVARLGDWFEVETGSGRTAWIHRSTVR
jgi:hypothetical protein